MENAIKDRLERLNNNRTKKLTVNQLSVHCNVRYKSLLIAMKGGATRKLTLNKIMLKMNILISQHNKVYRDQIKALSVIEAGEREVIRKTMIYELK